ncbi:MAG: hypothetical protein FRX48_03941 [Lasallia pustulata]|uniref:Uncharacterized protein n=1 Tax=Lasallia pustulata TaxID=136370 RepID=A0A5M8PQI8_9LECA|nr:MAG: hypothetical protein FRX48_03941 [Lasallia pustulata]
MPLFIEILASHLSRRRRSLPVIDNASGLLPTTNGLPELDVNEQLGEIINRALKEIAYIRIVSKRRPVTSLPAPELVTSWSHPSSKVQSLEDSTCYPYLPDHLMSGSPDLPADSNDGSYQSLRQDQA